MRIALDYDNCYDRDKMFWFDVVQLAKQYKHEIVIVTARSNSDDVIKHNIGTKILYCDGKPKKECYNADIWIDDDPAGIYLGSAFTPEQLAQWRATGRKGRLVID